jgi:hypothetical protein
MRRVAPFLLGLTLVAGSAAAQMPSKEYLISGFERQKGVLLRYVDAMPDSGMAFRPTPGVRSYAEQLEHIAQSTAGITRGLMGAPGEPPGLPTKAEYMADRAAMRAFMAGSFDAAIATVRAMTETDLRAEKTQFGLTRLVWQWVVGIQEHTAWTLGATVPYLRLNGVVPPGYLPF